MILLWNTSHKKSLAWMGECLIYSIHFECGFPPYWETKQFAPDIQQQNHPFMECQHFEKQSSFQSKLLFINNTIIKST